MADFKFSSSCSVDRRLVVHKASLPQTAQKFSAHAPILHQLQSRNCVLESKEMYCNAARVVGAGVPYSVLFCVISLGMYNSRGGC